MKAISSLIATVLMILITIAIIGIIIQAVMPIIKGNIEIADKCNTAKLTIETANGFTCYDNSSNSLAVSVSRGPENTEIIGFEMKFYNSNRESQVAKINSGENYRFIDKSEMPGINSEMVYTLNLSAINMSGITGIGIAPVLRIGKTSETCKIETTGISVKACANPLEFQQMANYTTNYTQNQSQNQTNQTNNQTNQTGSQTLSCSSPSNYGMIIYYPFEETTAGPVIDYLGFNNGLNHNALINQNGKVGRAYSFSSSSSSYVNSSSNIQISGTSPRTLMFWTKTSTPIGQHITQWGLYSAPGRAFGNYVSGGTLSFFGMSAGGTCPEGCDYQTGVVINNDNWYHVTDTYDGTTVRVYINGVLRGSSEKLLDTVSSPLIVGANGVYGLPPGEFYDGSIDEIAIFNRTLNSTEIQELYLRSNAGQNYCNSTPVPPACGNSIIESGEQCDDGNTANGDGCSSTCQTEMTQSLGCGIGDTAGIIAYWRGEGNANDIIGGNNGSMQGNVNATTLGKVGSAFGFDGTNSFISIPESTSLSSVQYTLEFWSRPWGQTTRMSEGYILNRGTGVYTTWSYIPLFAVSYDEAHENNLFYPHLSGMSEEFRDDIFLDRNSWSHIALSYNGSMANFYVNGLLRRSYTGAITVPAGNSIRMGNIVNFSNNFYKGDLDEIAFYNRALNLTEVFQHYLRGNANQPYC